jgi:hypothetical protein
MQTSVPKRPIPSDKLPDFNPGPSRSALFWTAVKRIMTLAENPGGRERENRKHRYSSDDFRARPELFSDIG